MCNVSCYTNSIFEQPWWLNIVAENSWKEILVEENDKVLARWVYTIRRNRVCMPVLTQTLGFWIHPDVRKDDIHFNYQKKIIGKLINQLPIKNLILSLDVSNNYFLPFFWNGFWISPRITYRINDLSNLDLVYKNFAKIVKKNIKTASNKVSIQEIDDISILYRLIEKTFQIQNSRYPVEKRYLDRIYETCKIYNSCKLLYAIDSTNNIHSGALFVYDDRTCYYLVAGTDPKYRSGGANSLLLWEGIQFAAKKSKCFDFEGSMIEGIENFVRQFGGEPVVYYEVKRLNVFQSFREMLKPKIKQLLGYK